jgi:hypothetical protein
MEQKRSCGSCTACCKTHVVPSIKKESNAWWQHCKIGEGCLIYDTRPSECADYACLWLKGEGSEEDRPDLSQCVIDVDFVPYIGRMLSITSLRPNAHETAVIAREQIKKAIRCRMPIFIEGETARGRLLIPAEFVLSTKARSVLISGNIAVHRYNTVT